MVVYKQGLAPAIVIVILVVLLGGGYLAYRTYHTQTTTDNIAEAVDTKDWKTYRNDEYGVEFNYPASLKMYSDRGGVLKVNFRSGTTGVLSFAMEALNGNYCYLNLCDDKAEGFIAGKAKWDYLGSGKYCDAGECSPETFRYRASDDTYRYYMLFDRGTDTSAIKFILYSFKFTR
ncbi:MAG: hypothetical protein Q7R88_01490 [bacterium]|nr:hypothetical protein [bacterium]